MNPSITVCSLALGAALTAAPGKLVVNGKTFELAHVYAHRIPESADPQKVKTIILATDRELPPNVRMDESAVREMVWDGKLNAVEIELHDGSISWSVRSSAANGSYSGSQSPDPYKLTVGGGRIRGLVKMAKPEKMGGTEFYYEFAVDAPVETKTAPPPPTAADKAAAANAASAKAYLAYQILLTKGDKAGLKKAVDPAKAAMIDTAEFPEMLKFIQSMQPKNIQVLRATESGDDAELAVSGNGGAEVGTVKMKKLNGNWLVVKESWKNR